MKAIVIAAKACFAAMRDGVTSQKLSTTSETLLQKYNSFMSDLHNENALAHRALSKHILPLGDEGEEARKVNGWKDYFNALSKAAEKAMPEVAAMNDQEAKASLGRIQYRANLLQSWFEQQDPRMEKALDRLGEIVGDWSPRLLNTCRNDGETVYVITHKNEKITLRM